MSKCRSAAAALLTMLWAAGPLWAQQAPAKPDSSAEAAAAMERAQRLANNPMKVILQASKFKRKAPEPEAATPEPADAAALRKTAARVAPPVATAATTAAPTGTAAVVAANSPQPANVPETTAPKPVAAGIETTLSLASGLAQPVPAAAAPVPALERTAPAVAVAALPKSVAPQAELAAQLLQPQIAKMVEPAIPQRVMDEAGRVGEVQADLTIQPDGRVSAVALLAPVPRGWQRYLVAALEQWRFEPLPTVRIRRVQLVFNSEP